MKRKSRQKTLNGVQREREASNEKGNKRRKKPGSLAASGITGAAQAVTLGIFLDGVMLHTLW